MRKWLYISTFLLFPAGALALSAGDYFALAPEFEASLVSAYGLMYTICTGSILAFYFFGWNAGWPLRFLMGILVMSLLNNSANTIDRIYNTNYEAFLLLYADNDLCDPATGLYLIYRDSVWCDETKDLQMPKGIEIKIEASEIFREAGVIGKGFSTAISAERSWFDRIDIFSSLTRFLFGAPNLILPYLFALLIWFFCPSRSFFERKGWIREPKASANTGKL